ncbi:PRC-barrel domain-containing protein [Pararhizobium mangrovi]|uniref:PRC-barrel domain-containing protein n=1 Tax=Pararhizobium mangrovi TaxID=2590452 RepID=A0A506U216_9HYPH|nr:PRC-barrel domain-containing protein [Pararhizobium mangrovi]TPW27015.1 hypothetical protein FJU11_12785 [Pararhizobium mangrovi]
MKAVTVAFSCLLIAATALPAAAQNASDSGSNGGDATSQGSSAGSSSLLVALDDDDAPVPSLNLMVDQVEDMTVVGSDGKEIGDVNKVLGDSKGQAKAISVNVGGFLGMGQKTVIIMLDDVKLKDGKLVTALSRQQLRDLPNGGDSN